MFIVQILVVPQKVGGGELILPLIEDSSADILSNSYRGPEAICLSADIFYRQIDTQIGVSIIRSKLQEAVGDFFL